MAYEIINNGIGTGVALGVFMGGKWLYEKVFISNGNRNGKGQKAFCASHSTIVDKLNDISKCINQTNEDTQKLNINMANLSTDLKNLRNEIINYYDPKHC
jgi:hypothetical protein